MILKKYWIVLIPILSFAEGCGNAAKDAGEAMDTAIVGNEVGNVKEVDLTLSPVSGTFLDIQVPTSTTKPSNNKTLRSGSTSFTIQFQIRSEKTEYQELHARELLEAHPDESGFLTFSDSAVGCQYETASSGNRREVVNHLKGSCLESSVVSIPDLKFDRVFLNATPLFDGPILLEDLKKVSNRNAFSQENNDLFRTYLNRLPVGAKTLTVSDLSNLLFEIHEEDDVRIDAVVAAVSFIKDPENAEQLTNFIFSDAANYTKAVNM